MGETAKRIQSALETAFPGAYIALQDESALHEGHAGAPDGGESHFAAAVVWNGFEGMNRVARHRAVNAAVDAEFSGRLHALRIRALTPEEAE